jgi:DNA-binding transcriptional MerR regulator
VHVTTEYTIQELSQKSGVSRRNIYFYTQQGILPPPAGAGLAARYAEIHLRRLQAIPILRRQGLRLDEIRARLQLSDEAALEQLLEQGQFSPPAPSPKFAESHLPAPYPMPGSRPDPGYPGPGVPSPGMPGGEPYLHYSLPSGLTLTAPANLSPEDRQRLSALLQAAQQIFARPVYPPPHPGWAAFTRSEDDPPRSPADPGADSTADSGGDSGHHQPPAPSPGTTPPDPADPSTP